MLLSKRSFERKIPNLFNKREKNVPTNFLKHFMIFEWKSALFIFKSGLYEYGD